MTTKPQVLLSAGMIQGGRSGVGRYVIELARRLARREDLALHLAGLDDDRHHFPDTPDEHWHPIPARFTRGPLNLWWHQGHLPKLLKQEGIDLLHIPSYRRIVANSPIPQIATIHDCAPFRLRDKYDMLRGFFGRSIVPPLARRCAEILTVSTFTADDVRNYMKVPAERVKVIPNGIDHTRLQPPAPKAIEAFRQEHQLDAPYLLYVSRLEHPGKNHLRLIEAFERFRNSPETPHCLLVLGGADWHGAEVIHKRIAESPRAQDIRLPGFLNDDEMPLWYGGALALVFPSLMEGFGLPVVEAMACGSLVACANTASLPEVGGEVARYFDPLNPVDIARALREITSLDALDQAHLRAQGLAWAARYHWDRAASETAERYLAVLGHA